MLIESLRWRQREPSILGGGEIGDNALNDHDGVLDATKPAAKSLRWSPGSPFSTICTSDPEAAVEQTSQFGKWCQERPCGLALGFGLVQSHGGANERLQRLFIDLVALMDIDGASGVAFEAGVEEA